MEQRSAAVFVEENIKTIFAYALSRVSNKDDAEDLTNDIVLEILKSADKIKNQDSFYAYVWEIALLSKEYRECTIAYYFDELSCTEISEKLNISLEMIKYYLFKTRKILKEGICMEREFGEKSFKPAPFEFRTIFFGCVQPGVL